MLFGRARLLNGQSSTPNSNRGCQPALYGTGRLAALAMVRLCFFYMSTCNFLETLKVKHGPHANGTIVTFKKFFLYKLFKYFAQTYVPIVLI